MEKNLNTNCTLRMWVRWPLACSSVRLLVLLLSLLIISGDIGTNPGPYY